MLHVHDKQRHIFNIYFYHHLKKTNKQTNKQTQKKKPDHEMCLFQYLSFKLLLSHSDIILNKET